MVSNVSVYVNLDLDLHLPLSDFMVLVHVHSVPMINPGLAVWSAALQSLCLYT